MTLPMGNGNGGIALDNSVTVERHILNFPIFAPDGNLWSDEEYKVWAFLYISAILTGGIFADWWVPSGVVGAGYGGLGSVSLTGVPV